MYKEMTDLEFINKLYLLTISQKIQWTRQYDKDKPRVAFYRVENNGIGILLTRDVGELNVTEYVLYINNKSISYTSKTYQALGNLYHGIIKHLRTNDQSINPNINTFLEGLE